MQNEAFKNSSVMAAFICMHNVFFERTMAGPFIAIVLAIVIIGGREKEPKGGRGRGRMKGPSGQ